MTIIHFNIVILQKVKKRLIIYLNHEISKIHLEEGAKYEIRNAKRIFQGKKNGAILKHTETSCFNTTESKYLSLLWYTMKFHFKMFPHSSRVDGLNIVYSLFK